MLLIRNFFINNIKYYIDLIYKNLYLKEKMNYYKFYFNNFIKSKLYIN